MQESLIDRLEVVLPANPRRDRLVRLSGGAKSGCQKATADGKQGCADAAPSGTAFINRYIDTMSENPENLNDQPLTEHLRELRSCLIYAFAAIFVGFCLSYVVIRPIGTWFFKPLTEVLPEGTSLIFTSYQEGFFFI